MFRVPAKGVISKEVLSAREMGHVVLKFKLKAERLKGSNWTNLLHYVNVA
jgi:hypothetical protein